MSKNQPVMLRLSWKDVQAAVDKIAEQAKGFQWDTIVAIMRGGMVPARLIAAKLGVENIAVWDKNHGLLGQVHGHVLIVDDIADTGKTAAEAKVAFGMPMAVLVDKVGVDYAGVRLPESDQRWVIFPWESSADKLNTRQSIKKETVE